LSDAKEPTLARADLDAVPEGTLSRYLREIRKYEVLSPEMERDLAYRWRDRQDLEAAHRLMTSHLRLVAKIAMGYRGYGLPVADLIGDGNLGMMQAVERFDPDRGLRLATYATWWIRAAILERVLHGRSLVKMGTTAAQRKLFFNLRRLKADLHLLQDGDLPPDQVARIARILDVPEPDVITMNRRLAAPDHSLNAPVGAESVEEWQDWLVDETDSPETALANREELTGRSALLADAWKTLGERQRRILAARRLEDAPASLEDLSQQYGISRERVRQIEISALNRLRKAMTAPAAAARAAVPTRRLRAWAAPA
jgi:RNA polymerase sigma-32 factor